MLDLLAEIEPGKAAAGFELGQRFDDIEPLLKDVRYVDYFDGFHMVEAIAQNKGVLVVRNQFAHQGHGFFFGSDVVRLSFSLDGRLGCIWVFEGYRGAYRGVKIGDPLSSISCVEPLDFDDGDEMYYRVDTEGEYVPGLAVVAVEANASVHDATAVVGYCVHDWAVLQSWA